MPAHSQRLVDMTAELVQALDAAGATTEQDLVVGQVVIVYEILRPGRCDVGFATSEPRPYVTRALLGEGLDAVDGAILRTQAGGE